MEEEESWQLKRKQTEQENISLNRKIMLALQDRNSSLLKAISSIKGKIWVHLFIFHKR